jgi:hypothetical protein
MVGLNLNPEIIDVLLRFRLKRVAFSADIKKAFMQISLHPDDRDLCRFLWENEDQTLCTYRFTRITFGLISSPFILSATIRHHLQRQPPSLVVKSLDENLYVDDFLHGEDEVDSALNASLEAIDVLHKANMELRQFTTSSSELRKSFEEHGVPISNTSSSAKVLGVPWDLEEDQFSVPSVSLSETSPFKTSSAKSCCESLRSVWNFHSLHYLCKDHAPEVVDIEDGMG